MFLVDTKSNKSWIMNLDNLEVLAIEESKHDPDVFEGTETDCVEIVDILQDHLRSDPNVLKMSSLI